MNPLVAGAGAGALLVLVLCWCAAGCCWVLLGGVAWGFRWFEVVVLGEVQVLQATH